jgi:hypothetical protein
MAVDPNYSMPLIAARLLFGVPPLGGFLISPQYFD